MMLGSTANSKHGMIIGKSARKCRNRKGFEENRSLERTRSSSTQGGCFGKLCGMLQEYHWGRVDGFHSRVSMVRHHDSDNNNDHSF